MNLKDRESPKGLDRRILDSCLWLLERFTIHAAAGQFHLSFNQKHRAFPERMTQTLPKNFLLCDCSLLVSTKEESDVGRYSERSKF